MSTASLNNVIKEAGELQKQASNPESSIWVMASAGTGKTTVLVERFIRLVLNGTSPDKILCLTYTKAAATQMKERILNRLAQWVSLDEIALNADVSELIGKSCTPVLLKKARGLMGILLDHLDNINILTIHAFCQSLLARFQIEAGLHGGVEIMEENKSREIFTNILEDIFAHDENTHIEDLLNVKGETEWSNLLTMIVEDRVKFQDLFKTQTNIPLQLSNALQIDMDASEAKIKAQAMSDLFLPRDLLKTIASKDKKSDFIQDILELPEEKRALKFDEYAQIFLTKKLEPRKIKADEAEQALILSETMRLMMVYDTIKSIRTRDMSESLCYLARRALQDYNAYKERHGVLDYHDLIEKTVELLSRSVASDWIRYKLDGGIDQVLVDEAQDTNPLQWHIIARLIEEYFSGSGTRDPEDRTLFVVGDIKQSIFGFQGADPETASQYQDYFSQAAHKSGRNWQDVPLNTSFRTAQDILDVVDACSAWGETRHIAGKSYAGRVELLPLIETEKAEKEDEFWSMPTQSNIKAQKQLIEKTADKIKELLDSNIALASKNNEAIAPQDILVLVQKRTHYPMPLIQALRQRNIPVAGIDSFNLTDDMGVQDIISVLNWSIFPDDDLALAEILKSPFVGWNDAQLGQHAISRAHDLWSDIRTRCPDIALWLSKIRRSALRNPVDFTIQNILEMPCPSSEVNGYKALQRRLGTASMDAIEQLLIYARSLDTEFQNTLGFIHYIEKIAPRIKREMDGDNARGVRIMTIHGAKGLEAPVVFLMDTIIVKDFESRTNDLQWLVNDKNPALPLWAPRGEDRATILKELKTEEARRLREEYYRLLYVAMTRAKDYLIISGASPAATPKSDSWYFKVQDAMGKLPTHKDDNNIISYGQMSLSSARIIEHIAQETGQNDNLFLPAWPEYEDPLAQDISSTKDNRAKYIGRQWHKLLERAIDRQDNEWEEFFGQWVEDLPDIDLETGKSRLRKLRSHHDYGFLFQPGGAAEVAFVTMGDALTRGRIDRLVRTDTDLWIIDYKTRLDSTKSAQLAAYLAQMSGYKDAITPISGGLPVKTVLVDIAKGEIHVI